MPITQDRMLALIAAAQDYKQAAERTREQIERQVSLQAQGKLSAKEALDLIHVLAKPSDLLRHPITSRDTIHDEEYHYRKVRNINLAARRRAELRRGGTPVRQKTAPLVTPGSKALQAQKLPGLSESAQREIDLLIGQNALAELAAPQPAPLPNHSHQQPLTDEQRRQFEGEDELLGDGSGNFFG